MAQNGRVLFLRPETARMGGASGPVPRRAVAQARSPRVQNVAVAQFDEPRYRQSLAVRDPSIVNYAPGPFQSFTP
jgi:hypothetical protein